MAQPFSNPLTEYTDNVKAGAEAEQKILEQTSMLKQKEMEPLIAQERAKRQEFAGRQKEISTELTKPFQVPQATMADYASMGGMLAIIGTMFGGAGKQPAAQSLAAMTGTLDGYQKGRKDLVDRSFKEFEANMKRLQALMKAVDVELAAYGEDAKLGRESAAVRLEVASALVRGGSLEGLIRGKSADSILKAREHAQTLGQKAAQHADRIRMDKARLDAEEAKRTAAAAEAKQKEERTPAYQKDGKIYNIFGRELTNIPQDAQKFGTSTTKKPDAFSGDASMAVKEYTGATLPIKDAKDVTQVARAMGEADLLQKDVQNSPELIGRTGQVGRAINRYVDSFRSGKEIGDDPKLSQEQLIFAKRYAAYLVQYERGIAGGAKGFTVALQQRFNALLNQDQFNPEGFKNLMDQHITELASQGVAYSPKNINREKLLNLGRDIAYNANYGAPSVNVTQGGAAPPAGSPAPSAAPQRQLSPQDQAALDWANAHPQDPRSEKIKQRLGIK
jgi:hypothetical protein